MFILIILYCWCLWTPQSTCANLSNTSISQQPRLLFIDFSGKYSTYSCLSNDWWHHLCKIAWFWTPPEPNLCSIHPARPSVVFWRTSTDGHHVHGHRAANSLICQIWPPSSKIRQAYPDIYASSLKYTFNYLESSFQLGKAQKSVFVLVVFAKNINFFHLGRTTETIGRSKLKFSLWCQCQCHDHDDDVGNG